MDNVFLPSGERGLGFKTSTPRVPRNQTASSDRQKKESLVKTGRKRRRGQRIARRMG